MGTGSGSGSGSDSRSVSDLVCKNSGCAIYCAKIDFEQLSVQD